ncbi:hypothetical protein D9M71_367480 [compost metagenome]
MGGEELVDEVAFRPHDLDAVVLGALRQQRAGDEVLDLLLDALFIQLARLERVDRRLDGARRYRFRAVGITTGVEDLHADLATGLMYGLGNDAVFIGFFRRAQLGGAGIHPALHVRSDTAGDHQADAATGALGKIGGHALETTWLFFQAGVHRAHQGAVAQGGEPQVQRGEQVRVMSSSHSELHNRRNHGMRAPRTDGGARRLSVADIKEPAAMAQ